MTAAVVSRNLPDEHQQIDPVPHRRATVGLVHLIAPSSEEQLAQLHHGVRAGPASAQACQNHGRDLSLMAAAAWAAGAHQVHHLLREAAQGVSSDCNSMLYYVEVHCSKCQGCMMVVAQ